MRRKAQPRKPERTRSKIRGGQQGETVASDPHGHENRHRFGGFVVAPKERRQDRGHDQNRSRGVDRQLAGRRCINALLSRRALRQMNDGIREQRRHQNGHPDGDEMMRGAGIAEAEKRSAVATVSGPERNAAVIIDKAAPTIAVGAEIAR